MNLVVSKSLRSLLIVLAILTIVGVIMVYSSSYIYAKETFASSSYFFRKQLIFVVIGLLATLSIQGRNFDQLFTKVQLFHIMAIVLLFCTFIPHLGIVTKGARRWLNLGVIGIQPGELVKYTIAFFAISYFNNFDHLDKREKIFGALQLIIPLIFFLCQPDFGSFGICLIIISFVVFLSEFPRKYFYVGLGFGFSGITLLVFMAPYRIQRLMSYLNPWQDPKKSGFQIIQSFLAFANGSFWGKGVGNSNEKLFYLPEAHNDFILSVIGEELGFLLGVLPIVFLFSALVFFGFKIALNLQSKMASMTVSTITFAIAIQAFLNMGVVLGLLPTKGLNLPFISYGGSSLVANFLAIGVLISAARSSYSPGAGAAPSRTSFTSNAYRFDYRSRIPK